MKVIRIAFIILLLAINSASAYFVAGDLVVEGSQGYCEPSGGTDTYACNLLHDPGAYVSGGRYAIKADVANTGAATVNFSSLGAKSIVKVVGGVTTALADNNICAGQVAEFVYDGINMQLASSMCHTTTGTGAYVLNTAPAFLTSITLTSSAPTPDVIGNTTGQNVFSRWYSNTSTLMGHVGFAGASSNQFAVVADAGAAFMEVGTLNNTVFRVLQNGSEIWRVTTGKHMEYAGAAPTFNGGASASNCGVGSTVAGNDEAGAVTVGNSTNGGLCSMLTAASWTNMSCTCTNRSAPITRFCYGVSNTGAGFILYAGTTFSAADILEYQCKGYQ